MGHKDKYRKKAALDRKEGRLDRATAKCQRKKVYDTLVLGEEAALSHNQRCYRCNICRKWHLASKLYMDRKPGKLPEVYQGIGAGLKLPITAMGQHGIAAAQEDAK